MKWKVEIKISMLNDIVIDPSESGTQINNNKDDNSDVGKSQNNNMNEVPPCWKIAREETKGRDEDCTDCENYKSIEQERHGKFESGCRRKTNEDTECDDEHVNYSDISDTSTSTSLIQDGNMVHNSAPEDISSDSELENVIIRRKKKHGIPKQ